MSFEDHEILEGRPPEDELLQAEHVELELLRVEEISELEHCEAQVDTTAAKGSLDVEADASLLLVEEIHSYEDISERHRILDTGVDTGNAQVYFYYLSF
jgi:hypothetical protein